MEKKIKVKTDKKTYCPATFKPWTPSRLIVVLRKILGRVWSGTSSLWESKIHEGLVLGKPPATPFCIWGKTHIPILGNSDKMVKRAKKEHGRLRRLFTSPKQPVINLSLIEEELVAHIRLRKGYCSMKSENSRWEAIGIIGKTVTNSCQTPEAWGRRILSEKIRIDFYENCILFSAHISLFNFRLQKKPKEETVLLELFQMKNLNCQLAAMKDSITTEWDNINYLLERNLPAEMPSEEKTNMLKVRNASLYPNVPIFDDVDEGVKMVLAKTEQLDIEMTKRITVFRKKKRVQK